MEDVTDEAIFQEKLQVAKCVLSFSKMEQRRELAASMAEYPL
jgi:hypothetical protein